MRRDDVERVRYLCVARLDGATRAFFWESDGSATDQIVVDVDGFVITYPSELAAREAASGPWTLSTEGASEYDLDAIETWCESDAAVRDSHGLLNAWNLFIDLPRGDNLFRAADARALGLYDKLFQSCNLPWMTAPGEDYVPVWLAAEVAMLKRLLRLGLAEFRARVR